MFYNIYLIKFCTNFIKHTYVGLGKWLSWQSAFDLSSVPRTHVRKARCGSMVLEFQE